MKIRDLQEGKYYKIFDKSHGYSYMIRVEEIIMNSNNDINRYLVNYFFAEEEHIFSDEALESHCYFFIMPHVEYVIEELTEKEVLMEIV